MDEPVRILLIEDDEDDFILVRDLLAEIPLSKYGLEWVTNFDSGIEEIKKCRHDVYLLDYRLGRRNGLELAREVIAAGYRAPIIFLTGHEDYQVDMEAMRAGAADYLIKSQVNAPLLERSIRYAIERKRFEEALLKSHADLEQRTEELAAINEELQARIDECHRIEAELRKSESHLRRLSTELLNAQEKERKRIAQEIHDSLGASLSAAKFKVESALAQVGEGNSQASDSLKNIVPILQGAIDEARRIQMNLRPSMLDDLGILATIGWFCRQFESTYSAIRIKQEIGIREDQVPDPLKTVIYRVLQEAVNNIAKHSKATAVSIGLMKTDRAIQLAVRDNGHGFKMEDALSRSSSSRGLGLDSMRERTELAGGAFTIESTGSGTVIRATWPLSLQIAE